MRIGEQAAVGPLLVEKLSDNEWGVRDPGGRWVPVTETDDGLAGPDWAADAVNAAELREVVAS